MWRGIKVPEMKVEILIQWATLIKPPIEEDKRKSLINFNDFDQSETVELRLIKILKINFNFTIN